MRAFQTKHVADGTKINRVCDAIRDELVKRNKENKYMLPILTTYVKKHPQQLKEVLDLIRNMQKEEKALNKVARIVPPHLNPETMKPEVDENAIKLGSKEALEYVSWLVDPNRLFNVALQTYDLDLVRLVAT